jgi:hypothetical protein
MRKVIRRRLSFMVGWLLSTHPMLTTEDLR